MSKVIRISDRVVEVLKMLQDETEYGDRISESDFIEIALLAFAQKKGIDTESIYIKR